MRGRSCRTSDSGVGLRAPKKQAARIAAGRLDHPNTNPGLSCHSPVVRPIGSCPQKTPWLRRISAVIIAHDTVGTGLPGAGDHRRNSRFCLDRGRGRLPCQAHFRHFPDDLPCPVYCRLISRRPNVLSRAAPTCFRNYRITLCFRKNLPLTEVWVSLDSW